MRLEQQESTGKDSNRVQAELPLIAQSNPPIKQVSADVIAKCRTEQDAYRLCVSEAVPQRLHSEIAELLHISESLLSRILNADKAKSPRHAGRVFQINLQRICNNRVIDTWAALFESGMLDCQRTVADEVASLRAQLADAEARQEKQGTSHVCSTTRN